MWIFHSTWRNGNGKTLSYVLHRQGDQFYLGPMLPQASIYGILPNINYLLHNERLDIWNMPLHAKQICCHSRFVNLRIQNLLSVQQYNTYIRQLTSPANLIINCVFAPSPTCLILTVYTIERWTFVQWIFTHNMVQILW